MLCFVETKASKDGKAREALKAKQRELALAAPIEKL